MAHELVYGTVRESQRRAIYVLRVRGEILEPLEIETMAGRMREKLEARGELAAEIVVVQGDTKHSLRLFGNSYSVSRVRAALFNAAISWTPITLD